jgi:Arc/MetJ-type ribon-helix-helix transcriptional regulator
MTAKKKIAISLPPAQVTAAQRAVNEGRFPSVSAYVSAAIERQERDQALDDFLAAMSPTTPESDAWAARVLRDL